MRTIVLFFLFLSYDAWADVDLVKVNKSERKMYLLDGSDVVIEYDISLGRNPSGHKQQEGDGKTPEGSYTLDYRKEDSSFYRAMHISYPNEADKQSALKKGVSTGGFIMIHGQRNRLGWLAPITQIFNWTNGCIAISNSEIGLYHALGQLPTPEMTHRFY